ncbi:MAG: peptide-methionine (S)-S-oxide reductase MsrA, partial [Deltaproteobacteria bacterium]|nr:peptide-methionine (S)-S-oxide reductase MsrA [Deltaproteobacteria bacterium]
MVMLKLSLLTLGMIVMTATSASGDSTKGNVSEQRFEKATFAGGCFWCMEPPFDKLDGVISTTSGYTGGTEKDPTYEQVSAGKTGHLEAIEVTYDPAKVSYAQLLDVFWKNVDPTQHNGQFV